MGKLTKINLEKGDITQLNVDTIVNAANTALVSGGGVCGAIHHAAGPELLKECLKLNGCETGEAKITNGYNLSAKYVIHAVGPIWYGGDKDEETLLHNAYLNSLQLAAQNHIKSIAFPNISTGIYGFPKKRAAEIAVKTVKDFCASSDALKQVIFACFDEENYNIYRNLLNP